MAEKNLKRLMALICSVPVGQIDYDDRLQLYHCRCGCEFKLSGFFLKEACPHERMEAHRFHAQLSREKGARRAQSLSNQPA